MLVGEYLTWSSQKKFPVLITNLEGEERDRVIQTVQKVVPNWDGVSSVKYCYNSFIVDFGGAGCFYYKRVTYDVLYQRRSLDDIIEIILQERINPLF